jgi:hypothetical protein
MNSLSCEICPRRFKTAESKQSHVERVHDPTDKPFKCNYIGCNEYYYPTAALLAGRITHPSHKNAALIQTLLAGHQAFAHKDEKPLSTGRKSKASGNHTKHCATTAQQYPYLVQMDVRVCCVICESLLCDLSTLAKHVKLHDPTGKVSSSHIALDNICIDRPYKCDLGCPRTYFSSELGKLRHDARKHGVHKNKSALFVHTNIKQRLF